MSEVLSSDSPGRPVQSGPVDVRIMQTPLSDNDKVHVASKSVGLAAWQDESPRDLAMQCAIVVRLDAKARRHLTLALDWLCFHPILHCTDTFSGLSKKWFADCFPGRAPPLFPVPSLSSKLFPVVLQCGDGQFNATAMAAHGENPCPKG